MSKSGFQFRVDDAGIDFVGRSPEGPVGKHMRRIALQIYAGAHARAGVETGELRRKLYWKHARKVRFQYIEVGSKAKHAWMHHEGTKPHQITPDNGRLMRFNVGGQVVYAKKTLHPGTKGTKFLTVPMRRAVR